MTRSMLRTRVAVAGLATAALTAALTAGLSGQSGARNGEWTAYGGDLGNTRYAPLDQIAAANFSTLEVAWRFKTDNLGPRPEYTFQSTPLVVKGVLYSTGGSRRAVVALDAATGEQIWVHSLREGERGAAAPRQLSGRGLAYWSDGQEERILYVTPGYQLVALDAKTGTRIPGFGNAGIVDLKREMDQEIDLLSGEIGLHATPVVARDVVIVGAAHRSGGSADGEVERQGLRARLRRAHRQAPVDLPHHPGAGRVRPRHVAEGLGPLHRQHRRVGADQRRRAARARLPAGRIADGRLLRRRSPRQRALRRKPRRGRSADRRAQVALSARAPRRSGTWTSRARRSSSTSP